MDADIKRKKGKGRAWKLTKLRKVDIKNRNISKIGKIDENEELVKKWKTTLDYAKEKAKKNTYFITMIMKIVS